MKKIDDKVVKELIIIAVITVVLMVLTISAVVVDEKKARQRDLQQLQQKYLTALEKMQQEEKAKASAVTFDEAKKDLPKVDKVKFDNQVK
ncbi:MAG: hypothetical protein HQL28_00120 [Candidatus Omnitrophica bacterium]|nr:hypothetical protein [Candidatus Omnitrophota bacterium]